MFHNYKFRNNLYNKGTDKTLGTTFSNKRSVQFKDFSVRRKQDPLCPAFYLTDYKVQGKTLSKGVVDIKDDPSIKFQDSHRKFCSRNVQLTRFTTFDDVYLLERIQLKDVSFKPHEKLIQETKRLHGLQDATLSTWSSSTAESLETGTPLCRG
ncbi:hypothetical protein V8E54_005344 [Elaphomyces granulatus]